MDKKHCDELHETCEQAAEAGTEAYHRTIIESGDGKKAHDAYWEAIADVHLKDAKKVEADE